MDPLSQTRLLSLMNISSGHADIRIGVIDGPVDFTHPHFRSLESELLKILNLVHVRVLAA
jgi:hypothetical protein